ncbi:aspartate/glutamate racemase family protein [Wukongibacter sp. M2B1]|uniref:aspartate/glutamate racemase family protein n=1 Tax=Wukongibacter sp. M2B1 TaxID=3088895 RepID=UPI003D7A84F0
MEKKIVGILAGMGPRSTAPFISSVIDECQIQYGAKHDEDFPHMMIYSLPTPFYIDRPINHELMKNTLINGLKHLENSDVCFIAMPCNSAHMYYSELQHSIKIPLLNIITETVQQLPHTLERVTLFSTKSTFETEIYQRGIINSGHKFVFENVWQDNINELIINIKNNKHAKENRTYWNELIKKCKEKKVDRIIVACTDLNVVLSRNDINIKVTDSSQCLAKAIVREYLR